MTRLVLGLALICLVPRVAAAQQPETIEYYAQDAIGSIRVVFNSEGTVLARQDYAPFGRQLFTVPAMPKEGFGAQEKDDETAQAYFHARMFQTSTSRFTSVDPLFSGLFQPQSWNRYAYAMNDPLGTIDFDGLQAKDTETDKCKPGWFCSEGVGTQPKGGPSTTGNAGQGFLNGPSTFDSMPRPTGPGQRMGPGGASGRGRNNPTQGDSQINQIAARVDASAGAIAEPQTYVEFVVVSAAGGMIYAAGFAAVTESALGDLYARGVGLLNSNNIIRIGYGWNGPALTGHGVFRLAIGSRRLGGVRHVDLWRR